MRLPLYREEIARRENEVGEKNATNVLLRMIVQTNYYMALQFEQLYTRVKLHVRIIYDSSLTPPSFSPPLQ